MSSQLVLSVLDSPQGSALSDNLRWLWLGADGQPSAAPTEGDRELLRAQLAERGVATQSAWLLVPGARVGTRELEYSEKEKKHLRSLLPYQLEDEVIGDVDELHFALSPAADGRVTLAFTERSWLQSLFAELAALGVEVTRCWSAPHTLPLPDAGEFATWVLQLDGERVAVRSGSYQGFELDAERCALGLQLLLKTQASQPLPKVQLRAASAAGLARLKQLLPEALRAQVADEQLVADWHPELNGAAIDLCQGEFSQRLPLGRWWLQWKSLSLFAAACVLVYVAIAGVEIYKLNRQNLQLRQQLESAARQAIGQGKIVNAERQLGEMLRQLNPASSAGGSRVMELLSVALPQIAALPSVQVQGMTYIGETGELNINIQADTFATFQTLSDKVKAQGLNAELLSANVQGGVQNARLKITKP